MAQRLRSGVRPDVVGRSRLRRLRRDQPQQDGPVRAQSHPYGVEVLSAARLAALAVHRAAVVLPCAAALAMGDSVPRLGLESRPSRFGAAAAPPLPRPAVRLRSAHLSYLG